MQSGTDGRTGAGKTPVLVLLQHMSQLSYFGLHKKAMEDNF